MVPQTKVFVGSLPQGSRPEDLRKLFERFGVVTECDIMNRCGFVHMQTEEEAGAAIRALHNSTFNGGVITVERGRIKERGAGRGGGRGRGGPMRNGMGRGGGPMRGPHMGGGRDAPYMRGDRGGMRGGMRNGMGGGGYDRGMGGGGYDDRYGANNNYSGYGGEDRRGFALMDNRGRDQYAGPPPAYDDRRGGYGEELGGGGAMYGDVYDDREPMDRRGGMRGGLAMPHMPPAYDRPPRPNNMPNGGDMFSRRTPDMRGAGAGGYDRDPYAQQYPPMGRAGGAGRGGRDFGGGMPARRY